MGVGQYTSYCQGLIVSHESLQLGGNTRATVPAMDYFAGWNTGCTSRCRWGGIRGRVALSTLLGWGVTRDSPPKEGGEGNPASRGCPFHGPRSTGEKLTGPTYPSCSRRVP